METSNNNDYLLKLTSSTFHFYLSNNVLYLKIITNSQNSTRAIAENILVFSVDLNNSNFIKLACINSSGHLLLFSNKSGSWKKRIVTNLYINSYKYKNLKIYSDKKNTHILLLKSDKLQSKYWLISHYTVNDTMWQSNDVAKLVTNNNMPFYKADIDSNKNIHIIYKSSENNKEQLFYRIFNIRHNKWNIVERLSSKRNNIINSNLLCDTENNVYIVWSFIYNKNIKINFIKRKADSGTNNFWEKLENFHYNISNLTYPILLQHFHNIKLLWKQNSKIYLTEANIKGNTWSTIKTIPIENKYIASITCMAKENDQILIKAPLTYCIHNNEDIIFFGIDDIPGDAPKGSNSISNNENIINDDYTQIKNSFKEYLDTIGGYFKNKDIIVNLACEELETGEEAIYDENSFDSKNISKQLLYLYKELHNIKDKETLIFNSLLEIRKDYDVLLDKFKYYLSIDKRH